MTAQAIQTEYNGYRFRSRIEARWAYVFDLLGIKYDYEKEGYQLKSGYYLADFWLPEMQLWVEIKGEHPTEDEQRLAHQLADGSNHQVVILWDGIPSANDPSDGYIYYPDGAWDNGQQICECPDCGLLGIKFDGRSDRLACKGPEGCPKHSPNQDKAYTSDADRILKAYSLARKARFEHGETPAARKLHFQPHNLEPYWKGTPSEEYPNIVNYEDIAF